MVVVCLKPKSIAYEVPPGGLVTGVSGSLLIADVVSSFLSNCGRRNSKITKNKSVIGFALLAIFATSVCNILVQIKILFKIDTHTKKKQIINKQKKKNYKKQVMQEFYNMTWGRATPAMVWSVRRS